MEDERDVRLADMFDELNRSRSAADGTYYTRMDALKTVQLLIVDDLCEASHKSSNAKHRVMRSGRRRRTGTCVCALRHFA
jgi:DNA replication protein DnaC